MTSSDYLHAALRQPVLFTQRPDRVVANFNGVVEKFHEDGLTRADYLKSALSFPALFSSKPSTIIRHVEAMADMVSEDLLDLPAPKHGPDTPVARVLAICRESASLFVLSDESIELRARFARTGQAPRSAALLKWPRHAVEAALDALEKDEGPDGVPPSPSFRSKAAT